MQLIFLVIGERVLLLILTALLGINQSLALLLRVSLRGNHGGHSSGFSPGMLFATARIVDNDDIVVDLVAGFWGRCGKDSAVLFNFESHQ